MSSPQERVVLQSLNRISLLCLFAGMASLALGWVVPVRTQAFSQSHNSQEPAFSQLVVGPQTTVSVGCGDTAGLIAAMNNPAVDVINLAAGCTYTVTGPDNAVDGYNGLPDVARTLTINGNGSTIQRDPAASRSFRLFHVSGPGNPGIPGTTGNLTLNDLTVSNGLAQGGNGGDGFSPGAGGAGLGGALMNNGGTVSINRSTLASNQAKGGNGGNRTSGASGGGGGVGGSGGFCVPSNPASGGGGGSGGNGGNGTGGLNGGGGGGGGAGLDRSGGFGVNNGSLSGGGGGGGGSLGNGGNGTATTGGTGGAGGGGNGTATGGGGGGGNSIISGTNGSGGGGGGGGDSGGGGGGAGGGFNGGPGGFGGGGGGNTAGGFGGGGGGFGGVGGFGGGSTAPSGTTTVLGGFGGGNAQTIGAGGGAGMGGAIFTYGGTLSITNSTFSGNNATGGNGLAVTFSYRSGSGSGLGGAIFVYSQQVSGDIPTGANASVTIVNSTLSGNSVNQGTGNFTTSGSASSGGGVFVYNSTGGNAQVAVVACTLTANTCNAGNAGGIANFGGTVNVRSTIIAGTTQTKPDVSGTFLSQGFNLIGSNSGSTGFTNGSNNDLAGTNGAPINPQLDSLTNNGGPTQTHAVQATSPAKDTGDSSLTGAPFNLTTDQRGTGFVRLFGTQVDIGAFEIQSGCAAPNITGQPGNQTVCSGATATFSVTATGATTFQWRKGTTPLSNGGNIAGATTATLTINPVNAGDAAANYNCLVGSGCSNVASNNASLTVIAGPAATATSNMPVALGGTLQLTAGPSGANLTYSWTGPNGFTSTQQNPMRSSATLAMSGTYTVTVTDTGTGCSTAASTQVAIQANALVTLDAPTTSYTGGTPPINPGDPSFGTFSINTVLRNLSPTETLRAPMFFLVTVFEKMPVVPGDPRPYFLDSRNIGTPMTVGARQDVTGPIAPGGSQPVSFRIAVDPTNRATFRFYVDLYAATNLSPLAKPIGQLRFTLGEQGSGKKQETAAAFGASGTGDNLLVGGAGAQIAPRLAVDGQESRRMAVAAENLATGTVTVKYTEDGLTWKEQALARTVNGMTYETAANPSLAYDQNGNLLVTYVVANLTNNATALVVSQKLLERLTFSTPVALVTRSTTEKSALLHPALAIDGGRPAVVWEELSLTAQGNPVSTIQLYDLAARRTVEVSRGQVSHPTLAVLANHSLVIGWNDHGTGTLKCRTGVDSASLGPETAISSTGMGYGVKIASMADVLATPGFSLVADPVQPGTLYGTFAKVENGLDVYLVRSTDSGTNWTAPVKINRDGGAADQFLPALAVDRSGFLALSFDDTRHDPTGTTTQVLVVRSNDAGKTFGPEETVTSVPSNLSESNPNRSRVGNYGDRMGLAMRPKGGVAVVWTDSRTGSEDIFLRMF
ncbi:MAG: hypothetical protein K1Y36_17865 [Blastocatellia bacterium]|nr:hypothetical protein [Blastocatellia bacterium]